VTCSCQAGSSRGNDSRAVQKRCGVVLNDVIQTINVRVNFRTRLKFNNNNSIYLLQLGCYPVAVVILHVYNI